MFAELPPQWANRSLDELLGDLRQEGSASLNAGNASSGSQQKALEEEWDGEDDLMSNSSDSSTQTPKHSQRSWIGHGPMNDARNKTRAILLNVAQMVAEGDSRTVERARFAIRDLVGAANRGVYIRLDRDDIRLILRASRRYGIDSWSARQLETLGRDLYNLSRTLGLAWNDQCYLALMLVILQNKNEIGALETLKEAVALHGVKVGISPFDVLISHFGKYDRVDSVEEVWRLLASSGIEPSCKVYESRISALARAGHTDAAMTALDECRRKFQISSWVYDAIINAFAQKRSAESCMAILDIMLEDGVAPTESTWNCTVMGAARSHDFKQTRSLIDRMVESGIAESCVTTSILISTLGETFNLKAAHNVLNGRLQSGVVPDSQLCVDLIRSHVNAGSLPSALVLVRYISKTRTLPLLSEAQLSKLLAFDVVAKDFNDETTWTAHPVPISGDLWTLWDPVVSALSQAGAYDDVKTLMLDRSAGNKSTDRDDSLNIALALESANSLFGDLVKSDEIGLFVNKRHSMLTYWTLAHMFATMGQYDRVSAILNDSSLANDKERAKRLRLISQVCRCIRMIRNGEDAVIVDECRALDASKSVYSQDPKFETAGAVLTSELSALQVVSAMATAKQSDSLLAFLQLLKSWNRLQPGHVAKWVATFPTSSVAKEAAIFALSLLPSEVATSEVATSDSSRWEYVAERYPDVAISVMDACSSPEELVVAQQVFDDIKGQARPQAWIDIQPVACSALARALVRCGNSEKAVELVTSLGNSSVLFELNTLVAVFRSTGSQEIQKHLIRRGVSESHLRMVRNQGSA